MNSEEKKKINYDINIKSNKKNNTIYSPNTQNYFIKEVINKRKPPIYQNIFNNLKFNKGNLQKQKTDFTLKSNSTVKRKLPLLTFNPFSFYDSLPSEDSNISDIDTIRNQLISTKSNYNKKKTELQELKIQYNKFVEESKIHKNLINEILQLNADISDISEEALMNKINTSKINDIQEKKLINSLNLINLRMEIINHKKILFRKNNELEKLKEKCKNKNIDELNTKLEDINTKEEELNNEIKKLEEILQKDREILPNLEKEYEIEKKNYDELNKNEKELKQKYDTKLHEINEIKDEVKIISNKIKSKTESINTKLKSKIEKFKNGIKLIEDDTNSYNKEKSDNMASSIIERKFKLDLQKKKNDELELQIKEFLEKNRDLYIKSIEYDEEKKKLENRGKETNKDIKKMKDLQEKLSSVLKRKQDLINECEEKEKHLKNNENEQKEKRKNVVDLINNLKNNIYNMNQQYDELKEKSNDIQKDIDKMQEQINDMKNRIEKIDDEDKGDKTLEELQEEKNKLVTERNHFKKENEKLKNNICSLDEQIEIYIQANEKLANIKE
jgi:chromosome segregation ATPase